MKEKATETESNEGMGPVGAIYPFPGIRMLYCMVNKTALRKETAVLMAEGLNSRGTASRWM